MGLFNVERPIYLQVDKGLFRVKANEGSPEMQTTSNGLDGFLVAIRNTELEISGEKVPYREYYFLDGANRYIVSVRRGNSFDRSVLNSLATIEGQIDRIAISLTRKDDGDVTYTNAWVYHNNMRCNWKHSYEELPVIETVTVGNRQIKDSSKQVAFLDKMAEPLIARLHQQYGDGMNLLAKSSDQTQPLPPASPTPRLDQGDPATNAFAEAEPDPTPLPLENDVEELEATTLPDGTEFYEPKAITLPKPLTEELLANGEWDGKRLGTKASPMIKLWNKAKTKQLYVKLDDPKDVATLNRFEAAVFRGDETIIDDLGDLPF